MNIEELYDGLKAIQKIVESKGLSGGTYAHINWFGDEVRVTVEAQETWQKDDNYWHKEKSFDGSRTAEEKLLGEAWTWAYALPNEEDRVIELMVQKLNKIADALPKGTSEIAINAWKEIFNMLKDRAEDISKNALPSPTSIDNTDSEVLKGGDQ